jgi:hypothetical protein
MVRNAATIAATIDPSSWSLVLSLSLSLVSSIYGQGACIGGGKFTISSFSFVFQTNCPFFFGFLFFDLFILPVRFSCEVKT